MTANPLGIGKGDKPKSEAVAFGTLASTAAWKSRQSLCGAQSMACASAAAAIE